MLVKFTYSKTQFDAAVKFVAIHNRYFLGKEEYIERRIIEDMNTLAAKFPDCISIGTLGYFIVADVLTEESLDKDDNTINYDIFIDPSLGKDKWFVEDQISTNIEVNKNVETF